MNLPMLNQQPIEKQNIRDDGQVDVVGIFATIQGEGPYAGMPSIFVRTAGCDLNCPVCDTDYTSGRTLLTVEEIYNKIQQARVDDKDLGDYRPLIIITGGEPFRQGLGKLVGFLLRTGYKIQVESNGTLFDPTLAGYYGKIDIVCSPKTSKINVDLMPWIKHLKYIISAGEIDKDDGLPTSSLNFGVRPVRPWPGFDGKIWVQPCDNHDLMANKANTQAAIDIAMKYGFQFCMQVHKFIEMP